MKSCHGTFDHQQKQKSSTERELLAIKYFLLSLTREISHEIVNIRTNNYTASRIIEIGSPKHNLQNLAIEIFEICLKHDIKLLPTWIPREENQFADYYSKIVDTDDWSIDNLTFRRICAEFGKPTVDRFADDKNKKCSQFNSKYHCPGSSAVNAFTEDWSTVSLNWLSPPIKNIIDCIKHLRLCKARGILIVPQWPSSHFWPSLHNGIGFEYFIKRVIITKPYYTSTCETSMFKGFMSFNTIAMLIDFS